MRAAAGPGVGPVSNTVWQIAQLIGEEPVELRLVI
jgi:hypothetical protein